jgi:hypothetical protein
MRVLSDLARLIYCFNVSTHADSPSVHSLGLIGGH